MTPPHMILTSVRLWPKQVQILNQLSKMSARPPKPNHFPDLVRSETVSELIRRAINLGLPLIVRDNANYHLEKKPCPTGQQPLLKALADLESDLSELHPPAP